MREDALLRRLRSPEGTVIARQAILKHVRGPKVDLGTLTKARTATGKLLANERPSDDEVHSLDLVIRKAFPAPKPKPDKAMTGLYARMRDGNEAERREVQALIVEMGRIARDDQQAARCPLLKRRQQRRNAVGGGSFFR